MPMRLTMPAAMVYRGISGSAPAPTVSLAALWRSPPSRLALASSAWLVIVGCLMVTVPRVLLASPHPRLYAAAGGAAMNPEAVEKILHGFNFTGLLAIVGGIMTSLVLLAQLVTNFRNNLAAVKTKSLEDQRQVDAEKIKVLEAQLVDIKELMASQAATSKELIASQAATSKAITTANADQIASLSEALRKLGHSANNRFQDERSMTENAIGPLAAKVEAIAATVAATPPAPSVTVNIDHLPGDVKP